MYTEKYRTELNVGKRCEIFEKVASEYTSATSVLMCHQMINERVKHKPCDKAASNVKAVLSIF